MGQSFPAHAPRISFATFKDTLTGEWDSLCYPCHEGQLEEWETSGHGTVTGSLEEFNEEHYVNNSSCDYCHTSEGFIRENDPAYLSYSFPEEQTFIGCPTCHDPHLGEAGGGNEAQLRNLGPVEVAYDPATDPGESDRPRMEGYGTAQVCAQCHHARRDESNVFGQIADGSSHFGPHGSPQMDMFIGAGCYEIPGYSYDGDGTHKNLVQNACVECHMVREELIHGSLQDHSFHTFAPEPGNCEPCHSNLPDFNYNNVQTDTKGLMDDLAVLLGYTDSDALLATWDDENSAKQVWERQAAYALVFVANDGSMGVHNSTYATSLLENAIAFATANQAAAALVHRD
jgi:formate-dependent nitrite reductase cytochrome c552 subunit